MSGKNPWTACLVFLLSACAASPQKALTPANTTFDISFIGIPFKANPIGAGVGADAIEIAPDGNTNYTSVVLVTVEKELKGSLPETGPRAPSKITQANDALKSKQILKVLLMDFDDPDAVQTKSWVSIAVIDPVKTFSIRRGSESERGRRYRIYLRDTGKGYHMVSAVPES